ncbi:hypothetical protein GW750_06260 [bacterium]|nr:hypothetical protein [bacterium]
MVPYIKNKNIIITTSHTPQAIIAHVNALIPNTGDIRSSHAGIRATGNAHSLRSSTSTLASCRVNHQEI